MWASILECNYVVSPPPTFVTNTSGKVSSKLSLVQNLDLGIQILIKIGLDLAYYSVLNTKSVNYHITQDEQGPQGHLCLPMYILLY